MTEYPIITVTMALAPEVEKCGEEMTRRALTLIAEKAEEVGLGVAGVYPLDVMNMALRCACIEIVALRAERGLTR